MAVYRSHFPAELLTQIIEFYEDDVPMLKKLIQVSTAFHDVAAEHLYRSVVVSGSLEREKHKLIALSGRPARFVRDLTICGSIGVPPVREGDGVTRVVGESPYENEDFENISYTLYSALSNFMLGAKDSIRHLTIDFSTKKYSKNNFYPKLALESVMCAVVTSLGSVPLKSLSSLSTNFLSGSDLLYLLGEFPTTPLTEFYRGKLEPYLDRNILSTNLRMLEKLEVCCSGNQYWRQLSVVYQVEQPLFRFISEFGLSADIKDLTLSMSFQYPVAWRSLPMVNPNITTLSLSQLRTFGLDELLRNCQELRRLSLSHIRSCNFWARTPQSPPPPWYRVFLSCSQKLNYLLIDRLSHGSFCERYHASLCYDDPNDKNALLQLIQQIQSRGGEVFQGPKDPTVPKELRLVRKNASEDSIVCDHNRTAGLIPWTHFTPADSYPAIVYNLTN